MKYKDAIAETTLKIMQDNPKVIVLGEGVTDQKGIFGTTKLAHDAFPDRVIETPLSENMLTGALAGLACEGWKPIYVHARAEFSLLSVEHLINTIAKWPALHGGQTLPIIIRMLVGRGWGQGPTHSQSFHSMFAGIPGLNVLYPNMPDSVGPMLLDAYKKGGPVIFIEPRRLYDVEDIDIHSSGTQVRIICIGDSVLDAVAARELLLPHVGVFITPMQRLPASPSLTCFTLPTVVVDTSPSIFGVSAELIAQIGGPTIRVGPHARPCPTAEHLEAEWYPTPVDIANACLEILGQEPVIEESNSVQKSRVSEPF